MERCFMKNKTLGNRIMILGCPGSGKSTLARILHRKTGLPVFHLDNIWWRPDRTHISRAEFDSRLRDVIDGKEWILDGDYSRTYEIRFAACDTVIFLDYGVEECLKGIANRIGTDRPDIPWSEDRLDPELVEQVKNYHKNNRPVIMDLLQKYPERRILLFGTRSELMDWVEEL